jgi:hypothetical protein
MALTITQAMVDALAAAIASGERSVSYDGRSVTYRDLDEMLRVLAWMQGQLVPPLAGTSPLASRRTVAAFDKDLGFGPAGDSGFYWPDN